MERVAFLVEETGTHIRCLLNPDSLTMQRRAGVRQVEESWLGGSDAPFVADGHGTTRLELQLLFDVGLASSRGGSADVRDLTAPLWRLAENGAQPQALPQRVHLIWGKAWDIPGIVLAVAERFERFDNSGRPQRSWMRMRFARCGEASHAASGGSGSTATPTANNSGGGAERGGRPRSVAVAGGRIDQLAAQHLGNPARWRELARSNDVADPTDLGSRAVIRLPGGGR